MAYKDKDKQKEVQRQWVRQKRVEKGSTSKGSTNEVLAQGMSHNVTERMYKINKQNIT